ncbi:MAG: GNAT family N-acetyltransferase [Spirochaetaceae bacterium]|nr:GNAT family N-acetyltransferase [Spirochaetaceae bacterium]
MNWQPAGRSSGKQLMQWLVKDEWKHIALTSRIKESRSIPRFGKVANGRIWVGKKNNDITGGFYISRYGVVLPAFDEDAFDTDDVQFLTEQFKSRERNLFSIIGMENRVLSIEKYLSLSPSDTITYRMLMGNGSVTPGHEEPPGVSIYQAAADDFDKLWKLEKAYQLEEVLRKGHRLDEKSSRLHFLNTLKNQKVYYALLAGRPVAKAGTNARGYKYSQIGGVFVIPELRNCGFGRAVMNRLLSAVNESGHHPCLFVKDSNLPALKLYENLGFRDMGAFRISYWK